MALLVLFAFIGGVVTILSPCILPILPVILSGSVTGGKRRPFGVITGFVLSFTFFTLFLTAIVRVTGLSADFLRNLAVIVLILFGLTLVIPKAQVWIERLFTKFASKAPQQKESTGFKGGFLVGLTLGLIWTPCVGPILASVISLALSEAVTGAAVFITLAYALGTALPMLVIIYGGRQLLHKVPWLMRNTAKIQIAFGILMIIVAIGIFFNVDRNFQTYILEKLPNYGASLTSVEDNETVQKELEKLQEEPAEDLETPAVINENINTNSTIDEAPVETEIISYQSPLNRPNERVSKKTFGQYITPANSPVQPERFAGYHTGVDFEIFESELDSEVSVSAFCEGPLQLKKTASGYGGVVVQECTLDDQVVTVVYGHLQLSSVAGTVGDNILKGETIGKLGAANSTETDGERKHLHFGIHRGNDINIKGYVQSESGLDNWIDPEIYW